MNSDFQLAKENFDKGSKSFNDGLYLEAEEYFTLSLKHLPDRVSTLSSLLITKISLKKINECDEIISKINALDQHYPYGIYAKALYHGLKLDFLKSNEELLSIINKKDLPKENLSTFYNCLGLNYTRLSNNNESVLCYLKAIDLNPENYEAYFNLGTTTGPDAGYIYSKQEYPGYTANGAIEKFVYATDSRTTVPQPSYYPSYGANGTGNSTNGYYAGGNGGGHANRYTRILKLNFSTSSTSTLPSSFSLPSGVYRSAASSAVARKKSPKGAPVPTPTPGYDPGNYELASGIPNHGYYLGGSGPNDYGNTNSMKMNFATDIYWLLIKSMLLKSFLA